mmetsp:Transcript_19217/g.33988  ORF Transcript_19217/g.33988 Transcript_19217/m.33988 type:complete len:177 (-) Transcript_19217:1951-2481(-)
MVTLGLKVGKRTLRITRCLYCPKVDARSQCEPHMPERMAWAQTMPHSSHNSHSPVMQRFQPLGWRHSGLAMQASGPQKPMSHALTQDSVSEIHFTVEALASATRHSEVRCCSTSACSLHDSSTRKQLAPVDGEFTKIPAPVAASDGHLQQKDRHSKTLQSGSLCSLALLPAPHSCQ